MTTWLLAFAALAVGDFCWAIYTLRLHEGKAVEAGLWAVALFGIGAGATIGYTTDHWLLIPSLAGAFAGTAAGVWWNKRKKAA